MLIGNVGRDPEVRYLSGDGNAKVATLRLATTERYRSRSGENTEKTEWHSVVAWRGLADIVEKYVKKGTQLYVEGRLSTRQWTDQSGNTRYTTEVTADNLFLLGRKPSGDDEGASYGTPYQGFSKQQSYQPQGYQQAQPSYQQPSQQPQAAPQEPKPQSTSLQDSTEYESDDLPF